jgi:hydroxymethylbilane synthase
MQITDTITLGSRGSDLALAQSRLVAKALERIHPALSVDIRVIRTSGDENSQSKNARIDAHAGRKGLFTAEIERELFAGTIDAAVHSAKDLPSELTPETVLVATLPRANTEDVLITTASGGFATLAAGACVGTASVRRQHQLRAKRPDLRVVDLRGNVPTRLRKLRDNPELNAVILARAGLERLGIEIEDATLKFGDAVFHVEILDARDFVPAGGQGIIVIQTRKGDSRTTAIVAAINDHNTFICLRAERELLRLLQGDCGSPVGVAAESEGESLGLRAQIFDPETGKKMAGEITGSRDTPELLARELITQIHGR